MRDDETATQGRDKTRRNLKPLGNLVPYMMKYKVMVAGACFFLALAAVTTLSVPLAVRRVIDHGFIEFLRTPRKHKNFRISTKQLTQLA